MNKVKSYPVVILSFLILLLASCDPSSSYEFRIHNVTNKKVTVRMLPGNPIVIETIMGRRSVSNDTLIIINPGENLLSEWVITNAKLHSMWEDNVIPLWTNIVAIKIGDKPVSSAKWKNPANWIVSGSGGGALEYTEKREYDLWLLNE